MEISLDTLERACGLFLKTHLCFSSLSCGPLEWGLKIISCQRFLWFLRRFLVKREAPNILTANSILNLFFCSAASIGLQESLIARIVTILALTILFARKIFREQNFSIRGGMPPKNRNKDSKGPSRTPKSSNPASQVTSPTQVANNNPPASIQAPADTKTALAAPAWMTFKVAGNINVATIDKV